MIGPRSLSGKPKVTQINKSRSPKVINTWEHFSKIEVACIK